MVMFNLSLDKQYSSKILWRSNANDFKCSTRLYAYIKTHDISSSRLYQTKVVGKEPRITVNANQLLTTIYQESHLKCYGKRRLHDVWEFSNLG